MYIYGTIEKQSELEEFTMRQRISAIVLALAVVVLAGCGAGTLSRTDAATMLKSSFDVYVPITWKIQEARICVAENPLFSNPNAQQLPDEAYAFERVGLVTIRKLDESDRKCPAFWGAYWYRIELTEKGRAAAQAWIRAGNEYVVEVARPKNLEVTSITSAGDSVLRAQYFLEYDPTPIGQSFGFGLRRLDATATFQRDDAGWSLKDSGSGELNMTRR